MGEKPQGQAPPNSTPHEYIGIHRSENLVVRSKDPHFLEQFLLRKVEPFSYPLFLQGNQVETSPSQDLFPGPDKLQANRASAVIKNAVRFFFRHLSSPLLECFTGIFYRSEGQELEYLVGHFGHFAKRAGWQSVYFVEATHRIIEETLHVGKALLGMGIWFLALLQLLEAFG